MKLLSECMPLVAAAKATVELINIYSSYANVISAPIWELQSIPTLSNDGARLLKCVHDAIINSNAALLSQNMEVGNLPNLFTYLKATMASEKNELLRIIFLDTKNYLIANHVLAEGTPSFVGISIRDVAHRSLQLGASSIILVHNHPSGDPTPSRKDIKTTQDMETALSYLEVQLYDHIIVGKKLFYSYKTSSFFPGLIGSLNMITKKEIH